MRIRSTRSGGDLTGIFVNLDGLFATCPWNPLHGIGKSEFTSGAGEAGRPEALSPEGLGAAALFLSRRSHFLCSSVLDFARDSSILP